MAKAKKKVKKAKKTKKLKKVKKTKKAKKAKKPVKVAKKKKQVPIGKVTHYYDRIGVAVMKLNSPLSAGDTIRLVGEAGEFTQKVESIQVEHQPVHRAAKGADIGLKVKMPVKENKMAFKVG